MIWKICLKIKKTKCEGVANDPLAAIKDEPKVHNFMKVYFFYPIACKSA